LLTSALDLTVVLWEAKHKDGTILKRGPGQYQKIDRANLVTISATYQGTKLFDKELKDRTFVWRLRSDKPMEIGYDGKQWYAKGKDVIRKGVVFAFLKRNADLNKNTHVKIYKTDKFGVTTKDQEYLYDPELSQLFFIMPNGKIVLRNTFKEISPFEKIKLRPEELAQLNSEAT